MHGCQLTFFTQQGRRHGHTPLCDWLLKLARDSGLHGATVIGAAKGFGHTGQMHSAGFFELADQPQLVMMTATTEQAEILLAQIRSENLQLFYLKCPAEFGLLGPGT
jgi:PII-like signaling protein